VIKDLLQGTENALIVDNFGISYLC